MDWNKVSFKKVFFLFIDNLVTNSSQQTANTVGINMGYVAVVMVGVHVGRRGQLVVALQFVSASQWSLCAL